MEPPIANQYERDRLRKIEENHSKLVELGLVHVKRARTSAESVVDTGRSATEHNRPPKRPPKLASQAAARRSAPGLNKTPNQLAVSHFKTFTFTTTVIKPAGPGCIGLV